MVPQPVCSQCDGTLVGTTCASCDGVPLRRVLGVGLDSRSLGKPPTDECQSGLELDSQLYRTNTLQMSTNSKMAAIQSHGLAGDGTFAPHLGQNGLPGSPAALQFRQIMAGFCDGLDFRTVQL